MLLTLKLNMTDPNSFIFPPKIFQSVNMIQKEVEAGFEPAPTL